MIAKDYLKRLNGGGSGPSKSDFLTDKSEAGMVGAVIGGLLGVYVGYTRNYNLLISAFLGGLAGNLATKAFLRKKKSDDKADD